jgi:Uma2 family endonuclease
MADAGAKKPRATYQDVLDAPEHMIAEVIGGELHLSPRPGSPHALAASELAYALGPPFHRGDGGPGGWIILVEPELHLGDDIVVPDLAGWRRSRMPELRDESFFTLAPDWICEVLSRRTQAFDRGAKMAVYARAGVGHAWLVHPYYRSIEVFRLQGDVLAPFVTHAGDVSARIEPFDAIALDLGKLWRDLPPGGSRASEGPDYFPFEAQL